MEYKGQAPSTTNRVSQPQPVARPAHTQGKSFTMIEQDNSKKVWVVIIIVVAVAVLGAIGMWAYNMFASPDGVKKNQYQAVFLTNGQVYFGKLSGSTDKYVELTDIYYLQVQQSVQPADKNASTDPQVSLAKLGSELHGPEDQMHISRDQVLFWENLKDDGKVVDAIKKNQQK